MPNGEEGGKLQEAVLKPALPLLPLEKVKKLQLKMAHLLIRLFHVLPLYHCYIIVLLLIVQCKIDRLTEKPETAVAAQPRLLRGCGGGFLGDEEGIFKQISSKWLNVNSIT